VKNRKNRWIRLKIGRKIAQNAKDTHPSEKRPIAGKSCRTTIVKICCGILKILLAIPFPTV